MVLTFAQLVNVASGPAGNVLMMTGHERAAVGGIGAGLVINVLLGSIWSLRLASSAPRSHREPASWSGTRSGCACVSAGRREHHSDRPARHQAIEPCSDSCSCDRELEPAASPNGLRIRPEDVERIYFSITARPAASPAASGHSVGSTT